MSTIQKQASMPYSQEQMYELVNDIEAYPDFLPSCAKAVILSKNDDYIEAEVEFTKGPIRLSWKSKNTLKAPSSIKMLCNEGVFSNLEGKWEFKRLDTSSCHVSFDLKYEFANKLLSLSLSPILQASINSMVDVFQKRAEHIYGKN